MGGRANDREDGFRQGNVRCVLMSVHRLDSIGMLASETILRSGFQSPYLIWRCRQLRSEKPVSERVIFVLVWGIRRWMGHV